MRPTAPRSLIWSGFIALMIPFTSGAGCGSSSTSADGRPRDGETAETNDARDGGIDAPEDRAVAPEAGVDAPTAGGDARDGDIDAPEDRAVAAEAGVDAAEAGGDAPEAGVDAAEAGVDTREAGVDGADGKSDASEASVDATDGRSEAGADGSPNLCGNGVIDPGEVCDPPNTDTCDSSCQTLPVACGNGVIQGSETCDFPDGDFCVGCQITSCGKCFFEIITGHIADSDVVCQALEGTARTLCQAVLNCEGYGFSNCLGLFGRQPFQTSCYCSDATCSAGANGRCAAPINAFAGTTDPAVIVGELNDSTSLLYKIQMEAAEFATSGCGATCTGH